MDIKEKVPEKALKKIETLKPAKSLAAKKTSVKHLSVIKPGPVAKKEAAPKKSVSDLVARTIAMAKKK